LPNGILPDYRPFDAFCEWLRRSGAGFLEWRREREILIWIGRRLDPDMPIQYALSFLTTPRGHHLVETLRALVAGEGSLDLAPTTSR
jgi:hypothetical protein